MAEPMVLEIEEVQKPRKSRAVTKANGDAPRPVTLIDMIGAIVARPDIDVSKVRELLTMQKEAEDEAAKRDFNLALNLAQAEMDPVVKDAKNDHTKSKYASFKALDDAVRPAYTRHGFSLSYNTGDGAPAGHLMVVATLSRGGHERQYKAPIPITTEGFKGTAMMTPTHATGSAMSYGQRYLLKLIFNVAIGESDDDGNGAGVAQTMVSDEQATELQRLISEKQLVPARVYAWVGKKLKVEPVNYPKTVSDIPARLYPEVVAQIKAAE